MTRGAVSRRIAWSGCGLLLVALIAVLINVLSFRHYMRLDWTQGARHSLSEKSKRLLAALEVDVELIVLMAEPERGRSQLYSAVRELLTRFARVSRRIRVRFVDVDIDAEKARLLAKQYGVPRRELRDGLVVVDAGKRRKLVYARTLVAARDLTSGAAFAGGGLSFRGEAALSSAVIAVSQKRQQAVCFCQGHGEAPIDSYGEQGYGYLADEVRRDGFVVRALAPEQLAELATPAGAQRVAPCDAIVIGGPTRAFSVPELDAIDALLARGGRIVVLLGPVLDRGVTRYRTVGLEATLAGWGVALPSTIVIDTVSVPGEQPLLTWATRQGYGDHPISRALYGRLTLWPLARQTKPLPDAKPGLRISALVQCSAEGWAETDLNGLRNNRLRFDPAVDARGPVAIALAVQRGRTRLVVVGNDRALLNRRQAGEQQRDYNRDFFLAALAWVSGNDARVAIGPKAWRQVRLVLDDGQLMRSFLLTVVALPMIALCAGLWVFWRRRR